MLSIRAAVTITNNAGDTQLEDSAPPSDRPIVHRNMAPCILSAKNWMSSNNFCVNDDKTEMMCTGSRKIWALTTETCLMEGSNKIQFKDTVKNL